MIEVQKSEQGQLNFVVKSKSGKILLQSVAFQNQGEIEETVEHLASLTNSLHKVERKTNSVGKFLFHLKNSNDKVIGQSGFYSSEAGMENGIKNILTNLSAS